MICAIRLWLIDIEQKLVYFIRFCGTDKDLKNEERGEYDDLSMYLFISSTTVPIEHAESGPKDSVGREQWMSVLHEAMNIATGTQQWCNQKSFS